METEGLKDKKKKTWGLIVHDGDCAKDRIECNVIVDYIEDVYMYVISRHYLSIFPSVF